MENISGIHPWYGSNFDSTLASRSAQAFCILGTKEILKAKKWLVNSWTNDWQCFKCPELQWMVSLTCLTIISESPRTFRYLILRSMALYKPWTDASYSAILFVQFVGGGESFKTFL